MKKENDIEDVTAKPAAAASLDSLLREAEAGEQAAQGERQAQADKQERSEADTLADDLASALEIAATFAEPGMWWLTADEFQKFWGTKVQRAIAESGAAIMRRHGLSMGVLVTQYGPYIALAGALGPSALATVNAYKREKSRQIAPASSVVNHDPD